jgi:hypothetical protein
MKQVFITGSTGGIGRAFADYYAAQGCGLILISKNPNKLKQVKAEIAKTRNVPITTIAADLSNPDEVRSLLGQFCSAPLPDIVINNAGFGEYGEFISGDPKRLGAMLNLNIIALTTLTRFFAGKMTERGHGAILNIASTAAFQPIPQFAAYAASKAYVLHLGEALHFELKPYGVTLTTLCPGPTATSFGQTSGADRSRLFSGNTMKAGTVARIGAEALARGKPLAIPGYKNRLVAFLSDINPSRRLSVFLADRMTN